MAGYTTGYFIHSSYVLGRRILDSMQHPIQIAMNDGGRHTAYEYNEDCNNNLMRLNQFNPQITVHVTTRAPFTQHGTT